MVGGGATLAARRMSAKKYLFIVSKIRLIFKIKSMNNEEVHRRKVKRAKRELLTKIKAVLNYYY